MREDARWGGGSGCETRGWGEEREGQKEEAEHQDPASLDLKRPGWRREAEGPPLPHGEWVGSPLEGPLWPCPHGQTSISLLNCSSLRYSPYPQGIRRPQAQYLAESKESRQVAASDTVHSEPGLTVLCTPLLAQQKGESPA